MLLICMSVRSAVGAVLLVVSDVVLYCVIIGPTVWLYRFVIRGVPRAEMTRAP